MEIVLMPLSVVRRPARSYEITARCNARLADGCDRMSSPCGISIDSRVGALSAHAHDSGTCLELGFPLSHFAHDLSTAVALQAADVFGIDSKPGTAKACHLGNSFLAAGSFDQRLKGSAQELVAERVNAQPAPGGHPAHRVSNGRQPMARFAPDRQ